MTLLLSVSSDFSSIFAIDDSGSTQQSINRQSPDDVDPALSGGEEAECGEDDEGEPEVPPAGAVRQREVVEAVRRGPQTEA